jgi:hypothetical protein
MKRYEFYYQSADKKTNIHAVRWMPEGKPVGIIQIAHGVTEYILRYEDFARYLTDKGFIVTGNDHLGHGKSIADGAKPMYFGPKGSWKWVVEDIKMLKNITVERYPDLPYVMLGFSLGSFVVRTYLINHPGDLDAAILMGTGQMPPVAIKIAKLVANMEAKKAGEDNSTPTIHNLTFGTYNKIFAPNRTEYDWLCSNKEALDEYIADPQRGGDFSAGLFRELLDGMLYSSHEKNVWNMDKSLPILLISGEMDPVGDCGKGVQATEKVMRKAGVKDIEVKMYPGLRHDILHEAIKEQVYADVYNWVTKKLNK